MVLDRIRDLNPFTIERTEMTNLPELRFESAPDTLDPQPDRTFRRFPYHEFVQENRPTPAQSFLAGPQAIGETSKVTVERVKEAVPTPGRGLVGLIAGIGFILVASVALGQLFDFQVGGS